jgi:hypothetical protein
VPRPEMGADTDPRPAAAQRPQCNSYIADLSKGDSNRLFSMTIQHHVTSRLRKDPNMRLTASAQPIWVTAVPAAFLFAISAASSRSSG